VISLLTAEAPVDVAAAQLERGLEALDFRLSHDQRMKLLQFLKLLTKWNRVYNLTAIRDSRAGVSAHLLDSLAVTPYLKGRRILDVGSGAGLPGIPLAIAKPEWEFVLVDSNQKKTAFLTQALAELKVGNASVVCERAETWRPTQKFDCIVCRALARLAEFVELTKDLLASGGVFAAMKGAYPREEIAELPAEYHAKRVVPLAIPGLNAQRHLVLIESA
jgi:16S rRNA (guanine527-N7)-methyltransferase